MAAPMRQTALDRVKADDASTPKRRSSPGRGRGGPSKATSYSTPKRARAKPGAKSKKGGAAAPPPPAMATVRIDSPAPQRPAWQAYGGSILDSVLDKMESDADEAAKNMKPKSLEDVMTIEDLMGEDVMEEWFDQIHAAENAGLDELPEDE